MEDNKKINDYVQDLYNKKINYLDIPYEYRFSDSIVEVVKELKLVKFGRRGFDIINNYFFCRIYYKMC